MSGVLALGIAGARQPQAPHQLAEHARCSTAPRPPASTTGRAALQHERAVAARQLGVLEERGRGQHDVGEPRRVRPHLLEHDGEQVRRARGRRAPCAGSGSSPPGWRCRRTAASTGGASQLGQRVARAGSCSRRAPTAPASRRPRRRRCRATPASCSSCSRRRARRTCRRPPAAPGSPPPPSRRCDCARAPSRSGSPPGWTTRTARANASRSAGGDAGLGRGARSASSARRARAQLLGADRVRGEEVAVGVPGRRTASG